MLRPPAHDGRELFDARAAVLDDDDGPVADERIVDAEQLSPPPMRLAESVVADAAELHHGEHGKRLERACALNGVLPQFERRRVLPRHRAPRSWITGAELGVELVRVVEVDLRVVEARVVEIGELEDEAFHELLARVGDKLLVVVASAGDHAPLEAAFEGFARKGVQERLVDRVPAQNVGVLRQQLVDDGAEIRRLDGEQVLLDEVPAGNLEGGAIRGERGKPVQVVLRAHGDGPDAGLLTREPVDPRHVVDGMHLAGCEERRRVGRQVARQQRRHQHAVLVDDVADVLGEVVAADHENELYAILVDQLLDPGQGAVGLEPGVVRHQVDHEAAHADLDAAGGVDPVAPDQAAVVARLGP